MPPPGSSSYPTLNALQRGFFRRTRHLHRWCELIERRVMSHRKRLGVERAPASASAPSGDGAVSDAALWYLRMVKYHLSRFDDDDSRSNKRWRLSPEDKQNSLLRFGDLQLRSAENFNRIVEQDLHPLLAARTRTDAEWDRIVMRLANEIGLRNVHFVTTHNFPATAATCVAKLELLTESENARACNSGDFAHLRHVAGKEMHHVRFFPSARSLTTLTLLYHEFGHVFWRRLKAQLKKRDGTNRWITRIQNAFGPGLAPEVVSEIAADAFGGLTGGAAFAATLCGHLLAKPSAWEKRDPRKYPAINIRGWLAREGALVGAGNDALGDSMFESWDRLLDVKRTTTRGSTSPFVEFNEANARGFLNDFATLLRSSGITLGQNTQEQYTALPTDESSGFPILTGNETVGVILRAAAEARDRCSDHRGRDYIAWEIAALRLAGLSYVKVEPLNAAEAT